MEESESHWWLGTTSGCRGMGEWQLYMGFCKDTFSQKHLLLQWHKKTKQFVSNDVKTAIFLTRTAHLKPLFHYFSLSDQFNFLRSIVRPLCLVLIPPSSPKHLVYNDCFVVSHMNTYDKYDKGLEHFCHFLRREVIAQNCLCDLMSCSSRGLVKPVWW